MTDLTFLETLWFVLICVLWIGYFVLEGFDFGVGMLLRRLGRDQTDRRVMLHTIGPVWDGNEVWLIVAGGATFAAFPDWYATLFSGFYLPLLLILLALIVRVVAFELWGKRETARWRAGWEWAIVVGSAAPALLWGVAWANIVGGVPMIDGEVRASLLDFLHPYALLGGVTTLLFCLAHGAIFLTLRTKADIALRAHSVARKAGFAAALSAAAFLAWTLARQDGLEPVSAVAALLSAALLAAAPLLSGARPGRAFAASGAGVALLLVALFADLFPYAIAASGGGLTLAASASASYTLTVMTVVAVVLLPVVLLYQGWTYWVFRHRLGRVDVGGEELRTPLDLLERTAKDHGAA